MIADPRAIADRWPEPRIRVMALLALVTSETPWALSRAHHERARAAGLTDEEVLHAIALSSFFGHLNRIADAVDVPLDYVVKLQPPRAEPAIPPFLRAPAPVFGEPAIPIGLREPTAAALAAWASYVARPTPALDEHARGMIAARVGRLLGDGRGEGQPRSEPASGNAAKLQDDRGAREALDRALLELADRITLAPWTLDAASYAPLRAEGLDDRAIFDACVVATSAGVFSRLEVALTALGRDA